MWTKSNSCSWAEEEGTLGRAVNNGEIGYYCCCVYRQSEEESCGGGVQENTEETTIEAETTLESEGIHVYYCIHQ